MYVYNVQYIHLLAYNFFKYQLFRVVMIMTLFIHSFIHSFPLDAMKNYVTCMYVHTFRRS